MTKITTTAPTNPNEGVMASMRDGTYMDGVLSPSAQPNSTGGVGDFIGTQGTQIGSGGLEARGSGFGGVGGTTDSLGGLVQGRGAKPSNYGYSGATFGGSGLTTGSAVRLNNKPVNPDAENEGVLGAMRDGTYMDGVIGLSAQPNISGGVGDLIGAKGTQIGSGGLEARGSGLGDGIAGTLNNKPVNPDAENEGVLGAMRDGTYMDGVIGLSAQPNITGGLGGLGTKGTAISSGMRDGGEMDAMFAIPASETKE